MSNIISLILLMRKLGLRQINLSIVPGLVVKLRFKAK